MVEINQIQQKISDLESRITEIENYKNPRTIEGRVENLFYQVEQMTDSLSKIMQKLNALNFDD